MERKPIFITKFPQEISRDQETINNIRKSLHDAIGEDYYVLFVPNKDNNWDFECYNHDLEMKEFAELRELCKESIKNN